MVVVDLAVNAWQTMAAILRPPASGARVGSVSIGGGGGGLASESFEGAVHAFKRNPTVFTAVAMLSTSAAEPTIIGTRRKRSRGEIRAQSALWSARGYQNKAGAMEIAAKLTLNGFVEELPNHPLVRLMNNPNPRWSGDKFWALIVMDLMLSSNGAFIYKSRTDLGNVVEMWRLRPDCMRIVPTADPAVVKYEYTVDRRTITYDARDIIHLQDVPDPMNPDRSVSRLTPIMADISIDNFLKMFVSSFYRNGGMGPGAILHLEEEVDESSKDEIRATKTRMFGGANGAGEWLILDGMKTSFTKLGLDNGLKDALPKELFAMISAELSMVFGIPASIMGQLIGLESSSYANKRADWQVFWDVTMTPLMSGISDVLNHAFLDPADPEFGGIDEICFDLSTIRALQEDEDALQERARKNFAAGAATLEETRERIGMDPDPAEGHFLFPAGMTLVSVDAAMRAAEMPDPAVQVPAVTPPEAPQQDGVAIAAYYRDQFARAAQRGRRPLIEDVEARAIYERCEALRRDVPSMTMAQVAARFGIAERTYRRYREIFG